MSEGEKTRAALLQLLREGPTSVTDLAEALGLTRNAIRFHLASLQAEGEIVAVGVRRHEGAGKPATLYMIAPSAEIALSSAYARVLLACVKELRRSGSSKMVDAFLR